MQGQGYQPVEPNLLSASHQARSAVFGSLNNVFQNISMVDDEGFCRMIRDEADKLEQVSHELVAKIDQMYEVTLQ